MKFDERIQHSDNFLEGKVFDNSEWSMAGSDPNGGQIAESLVCVCRSSSERFHYRLLRAKVVNRSTGFSVIVEICRSC